MAVSALCREGRDEEFEIDWPNASLVMLLSIVLLQVGASLQDSSDTSLRTPK